MRLHWLLLVLPCSHILGDTIRREWPLRPLSWWQRQYYQRRWNLRMRFTTTPRPGATVESPEMRIVYPCYCPKPKAGIQDYRKVTGFAKRLFEPDDVFFLNR
nr:uncharacterized protein LOC108133143 [Drosophila bipectinata]